MSIADRQISPWILQGLILKRMQEDLSTGIVMNIVESLFQPIFDYTRIQVSQLSGIIMMFLAYKLPKD